MHCGVRGKMNVSVAQTKNILEVERVPRKIIIPGQNYDARNECDCPYRCDKNWDTF